MEAPDGSPPQSLCMIRAAEFYPKSQMEKEDPQLMIPFQELAGESVKYLGRTNDGVLALSNYRICLLKNSTNSETSVPLGLIETVQTRDLFQLIINGKDSSTVKCSFETAEQCSEWQRRIQLLVGVPGSLETLFAFAFCSWTLDGITMNGTGTQNGSTMMVGDGYFTENPASFAYSANDERLQRAFRCEDDFLREVERLHFDLNGSWRISHANEDFKLCPSYPRKILVPCCISDETLHNVANFRASRRLPAVVWRHGKSGAILARSSQPEVGWLGWRNSKDEQLLKALADACAFDRGEQSRQLMQATSGQTLPSGDSSPSSPDSSHEEVALDEVRKVLIVDARSYTSAVTNRARGGGCECIEYYPWAEIEFMNLGNIHVIRKSFHALRQLCASPPDIPNWLGLLEKTMWLQHLSGLLAASMTVCHAIEKKGRPVLVHCSDGWDRTPQIVATALLCLDPFYRTVEGFRILAEREWLSYGHKFADRCGHGPGSDELNERCPVFLQWLDLVHQIHKQFPCSFEFSMGYLIKLAQHSLSCLFGTFFCNTLKERIEKSVFERTFSVWPFLSGPMYRNPLYVANREKVLWPAHNVRDLSLWTEVYLGSLGNQNSIDFPTCNIDGLHGTMSPMVKTRSYGDLNLASLMQNGISRRSSDPNMTVDPNLTIDSNSENNSIADIQSDRGDSPDITRKLQKISIELIKPEQDEHVKDLPQQRHQYQEEQQLLQQPGQELNPKSNASDQHLTGYNDDTLQTFWNYQQLMQQQQQKQPYQENTFSTSNGDINAASLFFSSAHIDNLEEIGCELNTNGCAIISTLPKTAPSRASANATANTQPNTLSECLGTLGDLVNSSSNGNHVQLVETPASGITVHKTADLNLDILRSVNMEDLLCDISSPANGLLQSGHSDSRENLWHGSVNTSTDTLVPIETHKQQNSVTNGHDQLGAEEQDSDTVDGSGAATTLNEADKLTPSTLAFPKEDRKFNNNNNSTNCSILPKVHSNVGARGSASTSSSRPIVLSTSSSNASISSASASVTSTDNQHNDDFSNENNNKCDNKTSTPTAAAAQNTPPANLMEESILILPEHQKLEISFSGKCETVFNSVVVNDRTTTVATTQAAVSSTASTTATPSSYSYAPFTTAYAQRRRRTSSSNSRPDGLNAKQTNGSTISRFSLPGVRSLPMTPPGLPERPQIAISCPDGLAHALSEQNIRLQQIVHEHKLRVDELMREMRDMRMALLKKICPNCNNASATNDEQADEFLYTNRCSLCKRKCCRRAKWQQQQQQLQSQPDCIISRYRCCRKRSKHAEATDAQDVDVEEEEHEVNLSNAHDFCGYCCDDASCRSSSSACSILDNVENASICSWEALEEHSGPSSCASSSTQPNATSIRWVPDHAVSRCTSCQTEFWLGRRKHHCRSCGQIFCADCSEFAAALPDEKLYSPVRLCGPCYHAITTRAQVSQFQSSALLHLQQSAAKSAVSAVAAATVVASAATSKA